MSSYQADSARFEECDSQVLGVSIDSVPSHRAFAKSLGGIDTYPLLADFHPKGEMSRAYGVFKENSGYTERAIFLIDKQGIVRFIDVHEGSEQPDNEQIFEELHKLS
jgi:peroxiredoxin